jgi:4-hydroxy-tetrahydrodipicolinate reductase
METILINGHSGKFGQAIYQSLAEYNRIGCNQTHTLMQALALQTPDVIIDVTNSQTIYKLLPIYMDLKIPTIIGTSGIFPKDAYTISKKADYPLLIVPNFAKGLKDIIQSSLMLQKTASNIQIIETHHQSKLDSPSGTSQFLAHILGTQKITSHRVDKYIAKHEIIITLPNKTVTFTHEIKNLKEFIPGVLDSIQIIKGKKDGDVLFF